MKGLVGELRVVSGCSIFATCTVLVVSQGAGDTLTSAGQQVNVLLYIHLAVKIWFS